MPAQNPTLTRSAILLASMTAVLWGANTVAVRYSVDVLPPIFVAALRFLIGAVFMLFWCRWEGSPLRCSREGLIPCLVTGVLLFIQIGLFNVGVEQSNSSHGALFINTFVFWVIAIDHFITRGDRLTTRKAIGVALAGGSVFLLLAATDRSFALHANSDRPTLAGDLILCLSAMFLGIKIIWTKYALRSVPPGTLILWQSLIGAVLFFVWSAAFESIDLAATTWPAAWGVLYQGIFVAGICFAVQAQLIRKYSASQISIFAFITPLAGVTFGVALRGDLLSPWLFVAAMGIAAGIYFVNSAQRSVLAPSQSRSAVSPEIEGTTID